MCARRKVWAQWVSTRASTDRPHSPNPQVDLIVHGLGRHLPPNNYIRQQHLAALDMTPERKQGPRGLGVGEGLWWHVPGRGCVLTH